MFGNNRFFACCISSRGIGDILPGWELASGLAFSEFKMATLKSIFLNNSRLFPAACRYGIIRHTQ